MIAVKRNTPIVLLVTRLGAGFAVLIFAVLLGPASAFSQKTYTETILHSFSGAPLDGAIPMAGVTLDAKGNIYGTTYYGGSTLNYGTLFKINTNGEETVLYSFAGFDVDGANPAAPLLLRDGNLYGTTVGGGCTNLSQGAGCNLDSNNSGTVFEFGAKGGEKILYSFDIYIGGYWPFAGLTADSTGNLYGTTLQGGDAGGTLYELNSSGEVLLSYDAAFLSGVILDHAGNLYGTTRGEGTVYEFNSNQGFIVLYTFGAGADGLEPLYGNLVRDAQGNLYGTTYGGGTHGDGTVFKLSQGGQEAILYNFRGRKFGSLPLAGLVQDGEGNLYGTTYQGGASGHGTVFKVTATGIETVLYSFTATHGDGAYPMGSLTLDASGNLYGTTQAGGEFDLGTVFKLMP
jgi:uncharacterized repeat protein (TIGR03803 family)